LLLVYRTDLLVALGFTVDVVSLYRYIYALFVELEGHIELTFHLVLFSDLLVDANQVFQNLNLDSIQISFVCLA